MQIHSNTRRARKVWRGLLLGGSAAAVASLLFVGRADAVDYLVDNQAGCDAFVTGIGGTGYWLGGNCYVTSGTLPKSNRLFVQGATALRPQTGTFTNQGEIEINATPPGRGYYGAGTFINEGAIRILSGDSPTNYGSIQNSGTFTTDVAFENFGPFVNDCGAIITGTILGDTSVTNVPCDDPSYPLAKGDRKCQDTIAKAAQKYFASRHKALSKCRRALMVGKALFADAAETSAVEYGAYCQTEVRAAAAIAKARQKVRDKIAKACNDTIVGTLQACGTTVDALAEATGSGGCVIDSVDSGVDDLVQSEYGY